MGRSATKILDSKGRMYHIECAKGDLAERILLVGDPDRAGRVAEHFDSVRFKHHHREFYTYTGVYKGTEISVMSSGCGEDNTEIAVIEACQVTDSPTFIRCGTCGALQKEADVGDLIISTGAVRLGNTSSYFVVDGYPAVAHTDIVLALASASRANGSRFHTGLTATASGFYGAQGRDLPGFSTRFPSIQDDLAKMNVLNFEMESATLFILAHLRGLRAGTICVVLANRPLDRFLAEEEYSAAEEKCIRTSLEAFLVLDTMDKETKKQKTPIWLPT